MADSQQVTSQTPATQRVTASKLIAQKTKEAREAQKLLLAVANAFLITAKHVDFSAEEEPRHHYGYPVDEVPAAKQSLVTGE